MADGGEDNGEAQGSCPGRFAVPCTMQPILGREEPLSQSLFRPPHQCEGTRRQRPARQRATERVSIRRARRSPAGMSMSQLAGNEHAHELW